MHGEFVRVIGYVADSTNYDVKFTKSRLRLNLSSLSKKLWLLLPSRVGGNG